MHVVIRQNLHHCALVIIRQNLHKRKYVIIRQNLHHCVHVLNRQNLYHCVHVLNRQILHHCMHVIIHALFEARWNMGRYVDFCVTGCTPKANGDEHHLALYKDKSYFCFKPCGISIAKWMKRNVKCTSCDLCNIEWCPEGAPQISAIKIAFLEFELRISQTLFHIDVNWKNFVLCCYLLVQQQLRQGEVACQI